MEFRRVIIESRYAPSFPKPKHIDDMNCSLSQAMEHAKELDRWKQELNRNIRYARLAMRDCLLRNEAPYASHLLYTQDLVLDDTNPDERKRGMLAGFAYRDAVEASVVYIDLGLSTGMQDGIRDAIQKRRSVWFRTMLHWEDGESQSMTLSNAEAVKALPELYELVLQLPGSLS